MATCRNLNVSLPQRFVLRRIGTACIVYHRARPSRTINKETKKKKSIHNSRMLTLHPLGREDMDGPPDEFVPKLPLMELKPNHK